MILKDRFKFLKNINALFIIYIAIAAAAGLGEYLKGVKIFDGREYTHYNNFLIFKYTFFNLI